MSYQYYHDPQMSHVLSTTLGLGIFTQLAVGHVAPFIIGAITAYVYIVIQPNYRFSIPALFGYILSGSLLGIFTSNLSIKVFSTIEYLATNNMVIDVSALFGLLMGAMSPLMIAKFLENRSGILKLGVDIAMGARKDGDMDKDANTNANKRNESNASGKQGEENINVK